MKLKLRQIGGAIFGCCVASAVAYAATTTLTLGTNGSIGGIVVLEGATSGSVTVQPPAVAGTGTLFQVPGTDGTNGQFLKTDGTGATSWATPAGSGTIATTTSALAGDNAGNAIAVTGTGSNCVHVDGTSAACPGGGGSGTVTNPSNLTTHAPIIGGTNGTTDVKALAALTNGQFSIGVTSADPAAGSFGSDFTNSSNVINLAQRTTHGDSIYTILSTDRYIVTSATLTAPRVWTLPAASTIPAGTQYQVYDEAGGASATNTIAITPNGTDTINGGNNASSSTIAVAYGGYTLKTDGSAKWTATANTVQQAYSCSAGTFASAQSASGVTTCSTVPAALLATGTSVSLTAPREYYVCTGTCTVTPPVPVAGYEFCVFNDDNVATVITLAALGSSARYENTARTAYGTAGTGTFVSGGAVGDKVCVVGRDSTHYLTVSFNGTWTAN